MTALRIHHPTGSVLMNNGVSPGEVGGVFAGIVALLVALGKGAVWLFGWQERRETGRTAKLDAWHDELSKREAKLDAETEARFVKIEAELAKVKTDYDELHREHINLGIGFLYVADDLRERDAKAHGLAMARALLGAKFPLHLQLPNDMERLAGEARDALDGGAG